MRLRRLRTWAKVALAGCCTLAVAGAVTTPATSSYFYDVESLSGGITASSPLAEISEACGLPNVEALDAYELVWGTEGNDELGKGSADTVPRIVIGLGGDDVLQGNKGDDCLLGGPGHDRLIGFQGVDRCVGGAGKDEFSQCEDEVTDEDDPPGHQKKAATDSDLSAEPTDPNAASTEVKNTGDPTQPNKSAPLKQGDQQSLDGLTNPSLVDDTFTNEATDDSETASSSSDSQQDVSEPPVTDERTDKAPVPPQDQTE